MGIQRLTSGWECVLKRILHLSETKPRSLWVRFLKWVDGYAD